MIIESTQNPKIKKIIKLKNRRSRDAEKIFLIEGFRELTRAVDAKIEIEAVFYCEEFFLGENEHKLIKKSKAKAYKCAKKVFPKISYRDRPDGLLAIAKQMGHGLSVIEKAIEKKKAPFLVIAESIEKPGNLGTILRSCDAAGVDGVIVVDRCTDIYNPNVVRASVGTLFTQPVVEAESAECIEWLKKSKIKILSSTPHADDPFTDVDLKEGVAIVVGTEQYGLSEKWMEAADLQVKIPMHGVADSLNVATATTLLVYEVLRQRKL